MKSYFWIPLACLAGIVVGAWGPRAEIRAMKELAKEEKSRPRNTAAEGFRTFAGLVNIPDEAKRPHRRRRAGAGPLFAGATNRVAAAVASTNAVGQAAVPRPHTPAASTNEPPRRLSPEDLRARIEEAQDLWRTRVELARATWKSRLKIGGADAERFDAALDEMNEHLYDTMQTLARLVDEKGKITPELGLRLVGDASAVMAESYEKVGACAPEGMRDVVSEMPLTDFIDPGVAEPLIAVQDKIERFAGGLR